MMLTPTQTLLTIVVMAGITYILRVLPFMLFPAHIETPKTIVYLSKVLPRAMIGLLVIYCFKQIRFNHVDHFLPELIASSVVVMLHLLKRNTLLSIASGTLVYMLLASMM